MPSFCAVFNSSNPTDTEKDDKSYYRFPSSVKNNAEGGLKLSKLRRKK